jgi:hypothetical protein
MEEEAMFRNVISEHSTTHSDIAGYLIYGVMANWSGELRTKTVLEATASQWLGRAWGDDVCVTVTG